MNPRITNFLGWRFLVENQELVLVKQVSGTVQDSYLQSVGSMLKHFVRSSEVALETTINKYKLTTIMQPRAGLLNPSGYTTYKRTRVFSSLVPISYPRVVADDCLVYRELSLYLVFSVYV